MSKISIIIFLVIFISSVSYSQTKLLFRYNSNYTSSSGLNSDIIKNSVLVDTRQQDEEDLSRGTDGWGYSSSKTTIYSTDSSSIKTSVNIQLNYFGDHEISGEIWFKSFSANGALFVWDDTTKSNGLKLYLEDGKLIINRKINNEVYSLQSDSSLEQLKWYHLLWFNRVKNNTIEFSLIIDGKTFASGISDLNVPVGLVNFTAPVYIGAAYSLQVPNFNGEIYAANLKNYIPDSTYIFAGLPFDGSAYFGIASFHDYALTSTLKNVDLRITSSPTPFVDQILIPYVDDDFIPQGLTNSYEDENFSGDGMIYLAMYNKTITDQTGLKNSIVIEIDPSTKKIRRTFRLQGSLKISHVGGIAFYNNSIYVSSGSKIEVYSIPPFNEGDNKYQDLYSAPSKLFNVSSVASFTTFFKDTLWIGDYRTSSQNLPYLYGYRVNSNGDVVTSEIPTVYRLPYNTQGVAWKIYKDKKYLFISASGGDSGSKVYRVKSENLFRNAFPVEDTIFGVPAGGEDISFNDNGDLLNVSESGAKYFQKRSSPWKTYFPFIFTIKEEVLFKDFVTSIDESRIENILPEKYSIQSFPNPFNNQTNINYSVRSNSEIDLTIYDSLGAEVATLIKGFVSAGNYSTAWNATGFSSGMYYLVLRANGELVSTNKVVLLK